MNPDTLFYFVKQFIWILLYVLDVAMLLRVILSWVNPTEEGGISAFFVMITEPIILPFRALCAKMHWFERSPLDVPFFMALLALILLRALIV